MLSSNFILISISISISRRKALLALITSAVIFSAGTAAYAQMATTSSEITSSAPEIATATPLLIPNEELTNRKNDKLFSEIFELTAEELADGTTVKTTATTTVEIHSVTSTALILEIKELSPEELPEIAWASTTTSTVWQIDIKRLCVENTQLQNPLTSLTLRSGSTLVLEPVEGQLCTDKAWSPLKPLRITLPTESPFYFKKIVYFWDGNKNEWRPLPSETDFIKKTVSARYPLPYGRFIVREHLTVYEGIASWYKWKNGHFAAFRFLPKKTKLKVTNISGSRRQGEKVEITINDYGPEEWTGRLIDLDYHAYWHIGNPRGGLMPVRVEVVK